MGGAVPGGLRSGEDRQDRRGHGGAARRPRQVEEDIKIFLSYRRDDTAGRAGRLHDALASDVSLVVIGPEWLRATDAEGRQRLDDPEDHVTAEVRSALASAKPVVPVLVGGASLPSEGDLPDDLRSLVRRQAIELNDQTWADDVEMQILRLEGKEAAIARVGFISSLDPSEASLMLETDGPLSIEVTPGV